MKYDRVKEMWSVVADAPLQSVLDSPECPPLLRQTLTGVLSWQTRNETPVRRALTSPRIAPQWVAALLALGATVTVEGDAGSAEVPLEVLLQRKAEGRVSALYVGVGGVMWGEAHVARTPADEPIVAAVAVVEMDAPSTGSPPRVLAVAGQAPSTGSGQAARRPPSCGGAPVEPVATARSYTPPIHPRPRKKARSPDAPSQAPAPT